MKVLKIADNGTVFNRSEGNLSEILMSALLSTIRLMFLKDLITSNF